MGAGQSTLPSFVGLSLLALMGCGGSQPTLVPVSGIAKYKGEPLEGAELIFVPVKAPQAPELAAPPMRMVASP